MKFGNPATILETLRNRLRESLLIMLLVGQPACTTLKLESEPKVAQTQIMAIEPDDYGRVIKCGWGCGSPPMRVSATSTFRDGVYCYCPENLIDGEKDSVWIEGIGGDGQGERILFTFDMTERKPGGNELGIHSVSIINGFARSEKLWKENSRVKTFKIYFDGDYRGSVELQDIPTYQRVNLPRMVFVPGKKHEVALEIAEVYPGRNYYFTAVADFLFDGFGVTH